MEESPLRFPYLLFSCGKESADAPTKEKIICFLVEQSCVSFLTKTKKFKYLVETTSEILPTITNEPSFLVEHKEMALIGELMKAARWGPIGVPILILCYSIG